MFHTKCLATKIKNWQGHQIDRFLVFLLCVVKSTYFSTAKGPPPRMAFYPRKGMKESFLFVMLAPLQRRMELTAMGKRKSEELYGKAKNFYGKVKKLYGK